MRLDKYLKVSRLIKRRTVANDACDAGRVSVNGKAARASYDVKVGDVIEISFGNKAVKAEVLRVQETVKKEEAGEMFKYLPAQGAPMVWFLFCAKQECYVNFLLQNRNFKYIIKVSFIRGGNSKCREEKYNPEDVSQSS